MSSGNRRTRFIPYTPSGPLAGKKFSKFEPRKRSVRFEVGIIGLHKRRFIRLRCMDVEGAHVARIIVEFFSRVISAFAPK